MVLEVIVAPGVSVLFGGSLERKFGSHTGVSVHIWEYGIGGKMEAWLWRALGEEGSR